MEERTKTCFAGLQRAEDTEAVSDVHLGCPDRMTEVKEGGSLQDFKQCKTFPTACSDIPVKKAKAKDEEELLAAGIQDYEEDYPDVIVKVEPDEELWVSIDQTGETATVSGVQSANKRVTEEDLLLGHTKRLEYNKTTLATAKESMFHCLGRFDPHSMASSVSQNETRKRKRKIVHENRTFLGKWTDDYFFVEANNKALCLICREVISVFEDYDLKRHYFQMHSTFNQLQGECRQQAILDLEKKLTSQLRFRKPTSQPDSLVKASYVVANLIAKKSMPFTDSEFIKECLESVADIICPEKKSDFCKISLSHQTTTRCIEDIAKSIEKCLESQCATFKFYSIALDESTGVRDTTQLAIFIRGIDPEFNVTEELAALVPLKDTAKSLDLYDAVKTTLARFSLTIDKMSGIVTDSVPAMVGKKEGLTRLIEDDAKKIGNPRFMKYHCIIHQENMCATTLKMDNIMNVVIKTIHFIRSRGLNNSRFQEFLNTLETSYGDIEFFTAVKWLRRFYDLRDEIKCFMDLKGKPAPEFENEDWLADLAFLMDITAHLNELNTRLQVENQLINYMFQTVTAFEMKLKLWQSQIKNNNFIHFETLSEQSNVNSEKYAALLAILSQDFENRFQDFRKHQLLFSIFATPFSVDINTLPAKLQMECIELQSDMQLKEKFIQVSLLDFYKLYLPRERYPAFHEHALFMTSLLGSTYICAQRFSHMKHIKSRSRTKISDEHLENTLRIATTSIKPDIDALVLKTQVQYSH